MFFIIWGTPTKRKDYTSIGPIICPCCGSYARYNIYKVYRTLTLYYIPTIRWDTEYYAETTCCGAVYQIDKKIGKDLAKGLPVDLKPEHMTLTRRGYVQQAQPVQQIPQAQPMQQTQQAQQAQQVQNAQPVQQATATKTCNNCGKAVETDSVFCSYCGTKFE